MHWFVIITLWGLIYFSISTIAEWFGISNKIVLILWYVLGAIFLMWGIHIEKRIADKSYREKEEEFKKEQELNTKYGLPRERKEFEYLKGLDGIPNENMLNVWIGEKDLCILLNSDEITNYQIPFTDINFYSIKGDLKQELGATGKKNSDIETMMTEGMLGTAVAMKKNQTAQSLITIDERRTIINAIIDGKNSYIFFRGSDLYNYLLENLPEKEQSFVAMNK